VSNAAPGPARPGPAPDSNFLAGPRKRDPIWDGFAEWLNRRPETRSERGAWNKAAKELREIGADPSEIVGRGRRYQTVYPGIVPTPNGLVKHWSELNGTPATNREIPDPDWVETWMRENGRGDG
jgi:hypothetical protein